MIATTSAVVVAAPLSVEVKETEAAFDKLRPDWDRLFLADGRSIFQSFEWQRAWWKHFGEGNANMELSIAVVRAAADARHPEGRIVAVAPLFIERLKAFGVVEVRRLAFLGRQISDYLDVIADPEHRAAVAEALAHHLSESSGAWDVCVLEDMTERSPTAAALYEALGTLGVGRVLFTNERCPRALLKRSWDETLASFKAEHRREIKRRRRNFEKHCGFELEIAGDARSIDADIDQFIAMHQEHWTGSGHRGALADGSLQRFHRDVARDLAARGWTFLAFLRVHGRRIAVVYGFRFNNELSIYLSGTHNTGDLRQLSPGRVLTSLVMEHASAASISAYDFMRGTEQYKYELGGVDVANHTLIVQGTRSFFSSDKHRAALLSEALGRRFDHERVLWSHATSGAGLLSVPSALHLQERAAVIWRDGLRKLRHPERSLTAETTAVVPRPA